MTRRTRQDLRAGIQSDPKPEEPATVPAKDVDPAGVKPAGATDSDATGDVVDQVVDEVLAAAGPDPDPAAVGQAVLQAAPKPATRKTAARKTATSKVSDLEAEVARLQAALEVQQAPEPERDPFVDARGLLEAIASRSVDPLREGRSPLSVNLAPDLVRDLAVFCATAGVTRRVLVGHLVQEFLESWKKPADDMPPSDSETVAQASE